MMHCYAPNFEEVEGANWCGPVRLCVHLPKRISHLNARVNVNFAMVDVNFQTVSVT